MGKKLYFSFENDEDTSIITADIQVIVSIIEGDLHGINETDELYSYTITPIWLTDEEFENLPEAEF